MTKVDLVVRRKCLKKSVSSQYQQSYQVLLGKKFLLLVVAQLVHTQTAKSLVSEGAQFSLVAFAAILPLGEENFSSVTHA